MVYIQPTSLNLVYFLVRNRKKFGHPCYRQTSWSSRLWWTDDAYGQSQSFLAIQPCLRMRFTTLKFLREIDILKFKIFSILTTLIYIRKFIKCLHGTLSLLNTVTIIGVNKKSIILTYTKYFRLLPKIYMCNIRLVLWFSVTFMVR